MRRGLVVDLFAGGGGASVGIEAALGRPVDVAINHSATALAVHAANHPCTRHLTADIWEVKPREVTRGRAVDVLWASPDCTHFSVAKGGTPREKGIRSLAWVVVEWARAVRPRCIFLENVSEFRTWGPLGADGRPDKARMGETFEQWRGALELLGYAVDFRVLDASLYGAPTRRRRLFMVARCDGEPIRWPEPTHGPGRLPLRTAAECIDWNLPCPSIFERKKPLAEKTLWRIAEGVRRFVLENPKPFIVKVNHGGRTDRSEPLDAPLSTVTASRRGHALVTPTLIQTGYGERKGQRPRHLDLHQPLGTVVAEGQKHALVAPTIVRTDMHQSNAGCNYPVKDPLRTITTANGHAVVAAFLAKHYGGHMTPGTAMDRPMDTITATDHHALAAATLVKLNGECNGADIAEPMPTITASGLHVGEVRAFMMAYYGSGSQWQSPGEPMRTITAKHRLGLVTVEGTDFQIVDIGMRMLEPHELLRAQFGRFAAEYDLSAAKSKAAKVRLIGNSVAPEVAEAVVQANLGGEAGERRSAA